MKTDLQTLHLEVDADGIATLTFDEEGSPVNTMKLQWQSANQTLDFNPANAYISHYTNGNWDRSADTGASLLSAGSDTYTVVRSGVSSFSPFTVSAGRLNSLRSASCEATRSGESTFT